MSTTPGALSAPSTERAGLRADAKSVARHRRRAGLTQVQLAGLIGRSVPWVSAVEQSRRRAERLTDLVNIAVALGCRVEDLIGEDPAAEVLNPTARQQCGWTVIPVSGGGYVKVRGSTGMVELMISTTTGDGPIAVMSPNACVGLIEALRTVSGVPGPGKPEP